MNKSALSCPQSRIQRGQVMTTEPDQNLRQTDERPFLQLDRYLVTKCALAQGVGGPGEKVFVRVSPYEGGRDMCLVIPDDMVESLVKLLLA